MHVNWNSNYKFCFLLYYLPSILLCFLYRFVEISTRLESISVVHRLLHEMRGMTARNNHNQPTDDIWAWPKQMSSVLDKCARAHTTPNQQPRNDIIRLIFNRISSFEIGKPTTSRSVWDTFNTLGLIWTAFCQWFHQ